MTPDGHINYPLDTSRTQRTRFDNNSVSKSCIYGFGRCFDKMNPMRAALIALMLTCGSQAVCSTLEL